MNEYRIVDDSIHHELQLKNRIANILESDSWALREDVFNDLKRIPEFKNISWDFFRQVLDDMHRERSVEMRIFLKDGKQRQFYRLQ